MPQKYYLKVESNFTPEEIRQHTKIINIEKVGLHKIEENNFQNNFLSHFIINLNVAGGEIEFLGKYKADKSLTDIFCLVNHNADNTRSKIRIRGIVKNGGKIISRSKINVKKNLKNISGTEDLKFIAVLNQDLGEIGEIDAIPEIEVFSKDISVAHNLSISKISEKELWYRELHGASRAEAILNFEEEFLG